MKRIPNKPFSCNVGELNGMWKGDGASIVSKRERAQRLYELSKCELCGEDAFDRHHKDENTGHNERSNILILCRKCHMEVDGRIEKLRVMNRVNNPKKPFRIPFKIVTQIREMRMMGETYSSISRKLGISHGSIARFSLMQKRISK